MLQPVSLEVRTRQRDKWYYSRSNAVAWQKHQLAHKRKVKRHRPSTKRNAHTQAIPNPKKGWDVENESLKAHVSFTPQELNAYQSVQQNQTNLEALANA